jgi:translation initiation factor 6 (eIF-6)
MQTHTEITINTTNPTNRSSNIVVFVQLSDEIALLNHQFEDDKKYSLQRDILILNITPTKIEIKNVHHGLK